MLGGDVKSAPHNDEFSNSNMERVSGQLSRDNSAHRGSKRAKWGN